MEYELTCEILVLINPERSGNILNPLNSEQRRIDNIQDDCGKTKATEKISMRVFVCLSACVYV